MDPLTLVILLLVAAITLVAVEMLLPTHGALGLAGGVSALGAVAVAFFVNRWAGVGLLVACLITTPFVFLGILRVYEKSRLGRRLRLDATTGSLSHERIEVGDEGITLTDLRPMGHAEFGPMSVEATAQIGMIKAGTKVRVIDYRNGVATVQAVAAPPATA